MNLPAGPASQPAASASTAAILLAAGRGARMGERTSDKVLEPIGGLPILCYSLNAFVHSNLIDRFFIVYRDEAQRNALREAVRLSATDPGRIEWVPGGAERQDSVGNALKVLPETITYVFIHDCARPLIRAATLRRLLILAKKAGAASLARPMADTVKRVPVSSPNNDSPHLLTDLDRRGLWAMETPQTFERTLITKAYARVERERLRITDDTAAVSLLDHPVHLLDPGYPNPKLTAPEDFAFVDFLLRHPFP